MASSILRQAFYLLDMVAFFLFFSLQAFNFAEFLDLLHARNTFDQTAYISAEKGLQRLRPVILILWHCMQNGCGYGLEIHVHASQNRSRSQRVLQQGGARYFGLPGIQRRSQFAGMEDHLDFCGRKSALQGI